MSIGTRDGKSLYEKGRELIELAKSDPNPDARKLCLDAAKEYFGADANRVSLGLWITILAFYVAYVAAIVVTAVLAGGWAGAVAIGVYAVGSLLLGSMLRSAGIVSEAGLLATFRAGAGALRLLGRRSNE